MVIAVALSTSPDWMAQAVCAQVDPKLFYPEQGGSTRQAKAVCARCPVQAECLAYALAQGERYGIWGGLGSHTRRKLTTPARTDAPRRGLHRRAGWIAQLANAGRNDTEIAELAGCSTRTVLRVRQAAGIAPGRTSVSAWAGAA